MEKINIAELLKNCPKGMELDCVLFNNSVKYDGLDNSNTYPIRIVTENGGYFYLTKEGYLYTIPNSKCIIFPKGKTTWEGFVPPDKFKDGDILTTYLGSVFILKEPNKNNFYYSCYVALNNISRFITNYTQFCAKKSCRYATEEEKTRLFQAIKDNGYKWNTETKTLEKLIEPKFKVGNRVRNKNYKDYIYDIYDIIDKGYIAKGIKTGSPIPILFGSQEDNYELVPNKFDITTLKPFKSKVLVRDYDNRMWTPTFWGKHLGDNSNCSYLTTNGCYKYCIPYEGNHHLLGTTDDCDEYYKTWTNEEE